MLPSQRTLRDYTYYTKAAVGFANDVDSVEDYDQESESHLRPLTNEEQCALRYVAGYTIHKVYEKCNQVHTLIKKILCMCLWNY